MDALYCRPLNITWVLEDTGIYLFLSGKQIRGNCLLLKWIYLKYIADAL